MPGEAYNISADNQRPNLEVVELILDLLEKPRSLIRFVEDRAGHDRGYYFNSDKIRALGWKPRHDFAAAVDKTVDWYLAQPLVVGEGAATRASRNTTSSSTAAAWRRLNRTAHDRQSSS